MTEPCQVSALMDAPKSRANHGCLGCIGDSVADLFMLNSGLF